MSEENNTANATLFSVALFNIPRHNLITEAAFKLLNPNAKAKVEQMLQSVGMNERSWGGWADQIKSADPPDDPQTRKFLSDSRNKNHKPWHYVDLPLASAGYAAASVDGFTRPDDVVQMYKKCVRVFTSGSTRFSRVNALRLIGHLVGDIHQPLHIGCSFIDESSTPPAMVFDQATVVAKKLKSDSGGNKINLPNSGNMHSFWDGSLSGPTSGIDLLAAAVNDKRAQLVKEIVEGAKKLKPFAAGANGGGAALAATPLEDLARDWADEALKIALDAYRNVEMVKKNGSGFDVKFKTTKDDYIDKFRPIVLKQMKMAARRLADVLNFIYPQP